MNYLELCQKVTEKADVPGNGPSAVTGQTGILNKIVGFVADGWAEIQADESWWTFRSQDATLPLTTGVGTYSSATDLPADFSHIWPRSLFVLLNGEKKGRLELMEWREYRDYFLYESLSTAQPKYISFSPTGTIYFDTIPDQDYTIAYEYQREVQLLAANTDEPILPSDFHDVIWQKALVTYGEFYNAPEVYRPASLYLEKRMDVLSNRFLPEVYFRDNVYAST